MAFGPKGRSGGQLNVEHLAAARCCCVHVVQAAADVAMFCRGCRHAMGIYVGNVTHCQVVHIWAAAAAAAAVPGAAVACPALACSCVLAPPALHSLYIM